MEPLSAIGVSTLSDAREAALAAAQQALNKLGAARPSLAFIFFNQQFQSAEAVSAVNGLLGEAPLWGFSGGAPGVIENQTIVAGEHQGAGVVVALVAGDGLRAGLRWFPQAARDPQATARLAQTTLDDLRDHDLNGLLFAADGINGSIEPLVEVLGRAGLPCAGCLPAAEYRLGNTTQIAGNQFGQGALSIGLLHEGLRLASASASGWAPVGAFHHVTRAADVWIQELDGRSPAEHLERYFGQPARAWLSAPLNELVRQYPFGLEQSAGDDLLIRSPLRVEVDGSLRMSAPVQTGAVAHWMVGDAAMARAAATAAAQAACQSLKEQHARPLLALAFMDVAWRDLFTLDPQAPLAAVAQGLPASVPVIGLRTLGQVSGLPPRHLNQNLVVALLGAA